MTAKLSFMIKQSGKTSLIFMARLKYQEAIELEVKWGHLPAGPKPWPTNHRMDMLLIMRTSIQDMRLVGIILKERK